MSTVRRIAKNAAALIIAQGISYLLALIYMMYWARYLGQANYGIIIFAVAFTGIFAVLADFGLQQLTVREISRNLDNYQLRLLGMADMRSWQEALRSYMISKEVSNGKKSH